MMHFVLAYLKGKPKCFVLAELKGKPRPSI